MSRAAAEETSEYSTFLEKRTLSRMLQEYLPSSALHRVVPHCISPLLYCTLRVLTRLSSMNFMILSRSKPPRLDLAPEATQAGAGTRKTKPMFRTQKRAHGGFGNGQRTKTVIAGDSWDKSGWYPDSYSIYRIPHEPNLAIRLGGGCYKQVAGAHNETRRNNIFALYSPHTG